MDYIEKIKRLEHDRSTLEVETIDNDNFLAIEVNSKKDNSFIVSIICNKEDEKAIKKIYDYFTYLNFTDKKQIDTLSGLLGFLEKYNLSMKPGNTGLEFHKYDIYDNTVVRFSKDDIEKCIVSK